MSQIEPHPLNGEAAADYLASEVPKSVLPVTAEAGPDSAAGEAEPALADALSCRKDTPPAESPPIVAAQPGREAAQLESEAMEAHCAEAAPAAGDSCVPTDADGASPEGIHDSGDTGGNADNAGATDSGADDAGGTDAARPSEQWTAAICHASPEDSPFPSGTSPEAGAGEGVAAGPVQEFEAPLAVSEQTPAAGSGAASSVPKALGITIGARSSGFSKPKPEGGLGFGPSLPATVAPPQALAPAQGLCTSGACSAGSSGAASTSGAAGSGASGAAVGADVQLPPKRHNFKQGGLRTTVNTPECLVTEADAEAPLDPQDYMFYAQQYAALAQQYAAYAQYCAQFAPQPGEAGGAGGAALSSSGGGAPAPVATAASSSQSAEAPKNTPIMITPYRHNWLISGAHRVGGSGSWMEGLSADMKKTLGNLSQNVGGGCRSCTSGKVDSEQCRQM